MNYARIYAEFINDRIQNQPDEPAYFERHHILPRSLGGGDEPENIIRLTPEDHYFAHLLLAKIYGGKLWAALFLMAQRHEFVDVVRSRPSYGFARRQWALSEQGKEGLRGADNGNHNPTVYEWRNLDTNERRRATLYEMWSVYGGNRGMWTSAVNGGKSSAIGWALHDGVRRLRSSKGKSFEFVNRDGRTFIGTQQEFCVEFGVSAASGSRVVRHRSVTACGWRLSGVDDRDHVARKSDGKPIRFGAGKTYTAILGSRVVRGKRADVAKAIGCTVQQFSAGVYQIASGSMRTYKGWQIGWQDKLL